MFRLLIFSLCLWGVHGYFTLPGKCPTNVPVQEGFRLEEFYGKWHQVYHYSSDGQQKNNCSTVNVDTRNANVIFNISRVDRGLFHRYSVANVQLPKSGSQEGLLKLEFVFENAPRRLKTRKYEVHILATNNNYYATAYTCQYSPLIDKHFIYIWILSRKPLLNDVSKELALRPLQNLGIDQNKLVKDDWSKCNPKYYEDVPTEAYCFRYPVPI